jgi:hypothetical protein
MSSHDLKALLDDVPDTLEIVLHREPRRDPEVDAWRDARDESAQAFADWHAAPGPAAYVVYRAAQDREDAAQDALAHTRTSRGRDS